MPDEKIEGENENAKWPDKNAKICAISENEGLASKGWSRSTEN